MDGANKLKFYFMYPVTCVSIVSSRGAADGCPMYFVNSWALAAAGLVPRDMNEEPRVHK